MLSRNSSVSRRNASRRLSSKSGKDARIGRARCAGCAGTATGRRSWSTNASARGSASIRRTCCSSTAGIAAACRARARSSSSSSGMLLHRKNDRREASSRSLMRYRRVRPPRRGCRSMRNRNSGLTSTRSSATLDAALEAAFARARLRRTPSALDVRVRRPARRYARRASVERIRLAHACSLAGVGRHGRRRCGGGSACRRSPVTLNGPLIGDAGQRRLRAARASPRFHQFLTDRVAMLDVGDGTTRGPAFIPRSTSIGLSGGTMKTPFPRSVGGCSPTVTTCARTPSTLTSSGARRGHCRRTRSSATHRQPAACS